MPRIYGSSSDPHDYCRACMPDESEDRHHDEGEGPDRRGDCYGYDAEHPDYGAEDYHCEDCGRRLTERDNDAQPPVDPCPFWCDGRHAPAEGRCGRH